MSKPLLSLSQAQPADAEGFVEQLSAFTQALIDQQGWVFGSTTDTGTIAFTSEQVAAPDFLLPLVLHRANRWMRQGYGQAAPMQFRYALDPLPGKSYAPICTVVPEIHGPTASLTMWSLFIQHALSEWAGQNPELVQKKEPIPLDDWYQEWFFDLDHGNLMPLPAKPRQLIEPTGPDRASPLSPVLPARANPVGMNPG